jgi:hypothetical protein
LIDHNNLEEFADPHTYDIEGNTDTGIAFYTSLASGKRCRPRAATEALQMASTARSRFIAYPMELPINCEYGNGVPAKARTATNGAT